MRAFMIQIYADLPSNTPLAGHAGCLTHYLCRDCNIQSYHAHGAMRVPHLQPLQEQLGQSDYNPYDLPIQTNQSLCSTMEQIWQLGRELADYGIRYSRFIQLSTIILPWAIVINAMHQYFEGIMKLMVQLWTDKHIYKNQQIPPILCDD